jgi:hypothetical protein
MLLCGLVAMVLTGRHSVASPGPLAPVHSSLENQTCASCHRVRAGVEDARCLRCHSTQGVAGRLDRGAHTTPVSRPVSTTAHDEPIACAACHEDHRGTRTAVLEAADRRCATCHTGISIGNHPEFAARSAGPATGQGLQFSHQRHLKEVRQASGTTCAACHERATGDRFFRPISFDRHCASCHVKDGSLEAPSDPVSGELLLAASATPGSTPTLAPAERGRVQIVNLRHRDPVILANLLRMRQTLNATGMAAERRATRADIAARERAIAAARMKPATESRTDKENELERLHRETALLDALIASPPGAESNTAKSNVLALDSLAAEIEALGGSPVLAGSGTTGAASVAPAAVAEPAPWDGDRAALTALLDAISERGDPTLAAGAASLRIRLGALPPQRGSGDQGNLSERVTILERLANQLADMPDARARADAKTIALLAADGASRLRGGLTPEAFLARAQRLTSVLDAIAARDGRLADRVAPLRQALMALEPGADPMSALRRLRAMRQRALDRVRLDLELDGGVSIPNMALPSSVLADITAQETTLALLRKQLAQEENEAAPLLPLPASVPADDVRRTAAALTAACVKCHELDRLRLSPVAAAQPRLSAARFTHEPHVARVECTSCHTTTERSTLASDVNLPEIATCQSCHGQRTAPGTCVTCHIYHPPRAGLTGAQTWTFPASF